MKSESNEFSDEYDAPKNNNIDEEGATEVRDMTPSFRAVDVKEYFKLIKYNPHGRQVLFHESPARFKVPVAGRRFGKSFMVGKDAEPRLLVPNRRIWCVGPTYDLGEKEFRVIWDDMIVRLAFGREPKVKKAYNKKQGNMFIEFPWNTRLEVRSADKGDNLVGEKLDYAIMSEAAKHSKETWERYIRPSLSDTRGGASFGSTPEGMNWLHELWQYGQNPLPEYSMYASWKYPAWENKIIYPGGRDDPEIKLLERTMPRDWFLQEIAAEFTSFMGRIYAEFDETTHVKQLSYNPMWKNYMTFDWGFASPLAAIEFQVDPMDRVYVWREHYLPRVTLNDHIEILKHRDNPPGYKIDLAFGDCADPGAIATVCANFTQCVGMTEAKHGTGGGGDREGWREGVELVKSFLKMQQVGEADEFGTPLEEPWLYVDHSCKNTIREFNNYRTAPFASSKVERNPREEAQKYDDHCLVKGTSVSTYRGQIPIEEVCINDLVLTRNGYRRVLDTFDRGEQEVYQLVTASDNVLYGTGEHPVMTTYGWKLLRELTQSDMVFTWMNKSNYGNTRTGRIGTETQGINGGRITERFQKDMIFTTKMKTQETMTYRIWNVLQRKNTDQSIQCQNKRIDEWLKTSTELDRWQRNGTEVLKDALGTANMEKALGKIMKLTNEHVNTVRLSSSVHSIVREINSAPTNARALVAALMALTTSQKYVPDVKRHSSLTNIGVPSLVLENVVSVSVEQTKQRVFDLEVEDDHEFFANNVLVSNSLDGIRYGLMHIFKLGVMMRLSEFIDARELRDLPDHGYFTSNMNFS